MTDESKMIKGAGRGFTGIFEGGEGTYEDVHLLVESVVEDKIVAHPDACVQQTRRNKRRECESSRNINTCEILSQVLAAVLHTVLECCLCMQI